LPKKRNDFYDVLLCTQFDENGVIPGPVEIVGVAFLWPAPGKGKKMACEVFKLSVVPGDTPDKIYHDIFQTTDYIFE